MCRHEQNAHLSVGVSFQRKEKENGKNVSELRGSDGVIINCGVFFCMKNYGIFFEVFVNRRKEIESSFDLWYDLSVS